MSDFFSLKLGDTLSSFTVKIKLIFAGCFPSPVATV